MSLARLLRTWRAYRQLFGGPVAFVHRHDPARLQAAQRSAAREAWLSTQTCAQRRLAAPHFGDIH